VAWSALLGLHVNAWSSAPVSDILWPAAALLLGEVVRGRRELRAEFADRERRATEQREREAADRVREERLRVAREVHDIVAHTLAAVNVQTGVAMAAFDRDPGVARQALAQARHAGRDALGELRAAVALLRERGGDGVAAAGHSPTLADVIRLADQTRAAGIEVTTRDQTGDVRIPAIVVATAYRIVQEALTNVLKHAHASTATVTLAISDGVLTVEIVDNGAGPAVSGSGFGRTGMAERAAAIGGSAVSGPLPHGGFRVRARIPVGPAEAPE
jgi:signal transduction histidine kinase